VTELPNFEGEDVQSEVVEHHGPTTERSAGRRLAVQALYELDCADHQIGEVITGRLRDVPTSKESARYMRRLVMGVVENRARLDGVIKQYAPEWPLDQVAIIDRNILRLALYEMIFQSNLSVAIVINEAIELANLFGAEGSSRFVNGVLGALADDQDKIRPLFPTEDVGPADAGPGE
jgi:N utilization substance protein B